MNIAEIREAFEKEGLTFTDKEVEDRLTSAKMIADEVDAELVTVWAEDIHQRQSQLNKSGKSGGLAKGKAAQPLAKGSTQQPQAPQQPAVNVQPVGSAIHGTVKELVVTHSQGEKEAIAALASYYSGTSSRIVDGVNQHLALMDFNSPLESLVQQQRDGWASTHAAIAEAIANVNQAAGLSNAA